MLLKELELLQIQQHLQLHVIGTMKTLLFIIAKNALKTIALFAMTFCTGKSILAGKKLKKKSIDIRIKKVMKEFH